MKTFLLALCMLALAGCDTLSSLGSPTQPCEPVANADANAEGSASASAGCTSK